MGKRISLGPSVKQQDKAMARLLARAKKPAVVRKHQVRTSNKLKPRTVFVYGEDLRKGDVTRVTDSYKQPHGGWEQRTTEGEILKVDTKTKRLYSRTDIVIRDITSGEKREHTVANQSYMPLIGVTA